MKISKKIITAAKILLTLVFACYVLSLISFREVGATLSQINPLFILVLVVLFCVFILLGALNNFLIVLSMEEVPFPYVLKAFCISVSVGMFTPAYIGEFGSMTYLLRKKGFGFAQGLSVPSIDKFLTIIVATVLFVIGLWAYFPGTSMYIYLTIFSVLSLLLMCVLFRPLRKRIKSGIIEPLFPWTINYLNSFVSFFLNHAVLVCLNLMCTFARAFIGALMIWVGLFALGVDRGLWDVMFLNFVARMIGYIPITINGIGLLEGAAITTLSRLDIPPEPILLAFLIDRSIAALFGLTVILLLSGKEGVGFLRQSKTE